MDGRVKVVLLEGRCTGTRKIAGSARKSAQRNRWMDGVGVLWRSLRWVYETARRHFRATHSLQPDIIHKPNLAARTVRMRGGVTVMLLERARASVQSIAGPTSMSSRGRHPSLWRWGHGGFLSPMNLLLML